MQKKMTFSLKKGQGQLNVIFFSNFIGTMSPMLHTKPRVISGSREGLKEF